MKKLLCGIICWLTLVFPMLAQVPQGTAIRATNGIAWNRLTIGSGTLVGNITGATNLPMAGLMGAGGVNTAASNGLPGLIWTSAGNGGGYWTSNTALSGFVTTNLDLLVPGSGGFETNTYLFSGGILVVSNNTAFTNNTSSAGVVVGLGIGTNLPAGTVFTNNTSLAGIVVGNGIGTNLPSATAYTNNTSLAGTVLGSGIGTNVFHTKAGTRVTTSTNAFEITVNADKVWDGADITNLVYAPIVIEGTGISVATNTITGTGQKTFTLTVTGTNTATVTNVVLTAGVGIKIYTNAATDWTLEALLTNNTSMAGIVVGNGIGTNLSAVVQTNISYTAVTNAPWITDYTNTTSMAGVVTPGGIGTNLNAVAQTNISYTAVTNAPWLTTQTNISYTAVTNAPWALPYTNTTDAAGFVTASGIGTNLYPTRLVTADGLAPIAISGWPAGDLVGIFTNSNGAEMWYDDLVGYFVFNKGIVAQQGVFGDGSGLTNVPGSIVISGVGIGVATNTVASTGQKTYTLTYTGTNSVTVTNVILEAGSGITIQTNATTSWKVSTGLTNDTGVVGVIGTGSVGTNLSTLAVLAATTNRFTGNAGWAGSVTAKQYDVTTNSNPLVPDFTISANYFATNASFAFLAPSGVDTSQTKLQETTCIVTNSSGSLLTVTAPWLGTHIQGKWFVTNVTTFNFVQYAGLWTNGIACPRW